MKAQRITCSAVLQLLLSGAGSPPAALGGIIVFDNEPDFFQAATIVSTERFDAFPTGTVLGIGSATVDGIAYAAENPGAVWATAAILITPSPPNHFQTMTDPGAFETLTFGEGGFTDAVGFFLIRPSAIPPSVYRVIVTATDGEQLTETIFTNSPFTYRGYGSAEGIQSVTVEPVLFGGGISNVFFDNVSRGRITLVPEPSSLVLVGLGSFTLVGYWPRRRAGEVRSTSTPIESRRAVGNPAPVVDPFFTMSDRKFGAMVRRRPERASCTKRATPGNTDG